MKQVEFISNNKKLQGTLFFPQNLKDKNPAILFIHGFTSEKKRSYQYAEGLAKLGYISFLFNMSGHGESEGNIDKTTSKEFFEDCKTAYDYITSVEGVDKENISVIGNSFGGYLGAVLTSKRKVKKLVLRVPADYQNETFETPKMENSGKNPEVMKWRNLPKKPDETFALQAVSNFNENILIIESEKDDTIPHTIIENYINAVKDKSKLTHIVMKNAPHSIKEGPFRDEVERILVNWFGNNS